MKLYLLINGDQAECQLPSMLEPSCHRLLSHLTFYFNFILTSSFIYFLKDLLLHVNLLLLKNSNFEWMNRVIKLLSLIKKWGRLIESMFLFQIRWKMNEQVRYIVYATQIRKRIYCVVFQLLKNSHSMRTIRVIKTACH